MSDVAYMEKLFVYLTNLSSNAAYGIIFGILLACGVGFPLPEDVPLVEIGINQTWKRKIKVLRRKGMVS